MSHISNHHFTPTKDYYSAKNTLARLDSAIADSDEKALSRELHKNYVFTKTYGPELQDRKLVITHIMKAAAKAGNGPIFNQLVESKTFQSLANEKTPVQPTHRFGERRLSREERNEQMAFESSMKRKEAVESIFLSVFDACVREEQPECLQTLCEKASNVALHILDISIYRRNLFHKVVGTACYEPFREAIIQYAKQTKGELKLDLMDQTHRKEVAKQQAALKAKKPTPAGSSAEKPSSSPIQQVLSWPMPTDDVQMRSLSCPPPARSFAINRAPTRSTSAISGNSELLGLQRTLSWPTITGDRSFAEQKS